jgi:hypothetical protein
MLLTAIIRSLVNLTINGASLLRGRPLGHGTGAAQHA